MRCTVLLVALSVPALAQNPIDASRVTPPTRRSLATTVQAPSFALGSSASDDFNRPDGSDMGPDWSELAGDYNILNNTGYASAGGNQYMSHSTLSSGCIDSTQEIDFLAAVAGPSVAYGALVSGFDFGSLDGIFVKIQDNNADGLYDRVYFYHGINGGSWGASSFFFDLVTPAANGRIKLTFDNGGDLAVLDVDVDANGSYDEQFTVDGLLSSGINFGTSFGIATYNTGHFDNWNINGDSPLGTNYCGPNTPNSTGQSGVMSAAGTAVASANDFTLTGSDLPDGQFAYFIGSRIQGFVSQPGGSQGNLCVLGNIARFNRAGEVGPVVGGAFSLMLPLGDFPEPPTGSVAVMAGETWNFQCWHRDFVGGNATSNFTDGLEVTFQ